MKIRPFDHLIPTGVALSRLLAATRPVPRRETLPVESAMGRRSARAVRSRRAVPPFRRGSWDGFAVVARSTNGATPGRPVRLRLVGDIFAETSSRRPLGASDAAPIATGGPLPPGADAVVIFEDVQLEDGEVVLTRPARPGDRIADAGEDFPVGAHLLETGDLLTPARLGALAAAGEATVEVWERPRVAIVPNGNELRRPGERLSFGQIHESNNASLAALATGFGASVTTSAPVPDREAAIETVLRRAAARSDLVLATGGSSVGERDFLPSIFPRLGRMLFHGIAVRPGKPTLAVRCGGCLVIGMPGHPTSCLTNGLWLVAPVLARLSHADSVPWTDHPVVLSEAYDVPSSSFATVVPLEVRDGRARPTFRTSASLTSLVPANAYVIVPPHRPGLRRGDVVVARLLPPPFGPAGAPVRPGPGRRKAK
ncbi:MAG: molybdopterin molybdotransferase MoeA [Thermoplasmata archaeon]|nr:molybdopterin molybdotransferase MoeA [Thermoplasmata archaeon]MCI4361856.1 molybdopterin molybdotransferase MoeA [Thermoplasmata archaeon]